jgi:exodeoxyribonuclease VII large subunit
MLFQEDSIIKKDPIKNNTPFTVTEISLIIKQYIENSFQNIEIKGEVSGIKIASSGHIYFSLKDENAVLNAICWRYIATKLPIQLEDGMEIICEGNISTYPGRSNYQIIIKNIKLAGEGILLAKLEEIRKKLTIEGIFDEKYKKQLPKIPQKIAIVTSLQGAVIQDIIHRLKDRFPIETLVWDVIVQGNEAAGYIVEAIEGLNNLPKNISSPDIIIVARGGGSIEDLWPFNEEIVVRAVFNSTIPIISAIGHETDTTLIDLVADKRAPTPTAAAELITPDKSQIIDKLNKFKITLNNILPNLINYKSTLLKSLLTNLSSTTNYFENLRNKFKNFNVLLDVKFNSLYKLYEWKVTSLKLSSLNLHRLIITNQDKLSNSAWRINELYKNKLNKMSDNLLSNKKLLISYNHKNILKRGFSLIRDYKNNKLIKSCNELKKDKLIKIELYDGIIHSQLKSVQNKKNRASLEDKTKIKTQNKLPFSLE